MITIVGFQNPKVIRSEAVVEEVDRPQQAHHRTARLRQATMTMVQKLQAIPAMTPSPASYKTLQTEDELFSCDSHETC